MRGVRRNGTLQLVAFLSPQHLWRKRESVELLWRAMSALVLPRLPPASCDSPQQAVFFKRRPGIPPSRWSSSAHQRFELCYSARWHGRAQPPTGEQLRKRERLADACSHPVGAVASGSEADTHGRSPSSRGPGAATGSRCNWSGDRGSRSPECSDCSA